MGEGLGVSERRACRALGQYRTTRRHPVQHRPDEEPLRTAIVALATRYGRYGYRRITALLRQAGWVVSAKRVARLWRPERLEVPHRQPKRGRLWLNDGSCLRLRPEYPNRVWASDFLTDRTHGGRAFRGLTIVDECTRECLAIVAARKLTADDVLATRAELFVRRGCPAHLRSDNGPEFCAKIVRAWLDWIEVRTLFIEPGSPWENGYNESFNGKLCDELLDREIFFTLREAQVLIEMVAAALQHREAARCLGLSAPGPRGAGSPHAHPAAAPGAGVRSRLELTLRVDQSMGAGH